MASLHFTKPRGEDEAKINNNEACIDISLNPFTSTFR